MSLPAQSDIYDRVISPNRGSDVRDMPFDFQTIEGHDAPLDGWSVGIVNASPELAGLVTVVPFDLSRGMLRVSIEWADTLVAGVVYQFQVRVQLGTFDQTTPPVGVSYR
jgi:hypothetical protein